MVRNHVGASVLLLVGGVHTVFPRLKRGWLVAIAAAVSWLPWNLGVWLRESIPFALAVALFCWGALAVAPVRKRGWVLPLAASLLLAVWWTLASVQTLRTFFSPKPPSPDPMELAWALLPSVLAIASLIASATSARSRVIIKR